MNNAYIYSCELSKAHFENFRDNFKNDDYLIDALVRYLENNNIEVFERRANIAATEYGWFGAFYEEDLIPFDDAKIIGDVIDSMEDFINGLDEE